MVGDHQVTRCGFGCGAFDTRLSLLRLPSRSFRGCCGFGHRFLRPCRLPGGGHFRLLRSFRDLLTRLFKMWVVGWSRGGLGDAPLGRRGSTPHPVPSARQRDCPLGFRSGGLASADALSAAKRRLLSKSCPRFLPLHTDTRVRRVVSPAVTAMRLFPQCKASTGQVSTPTSDAPGCVSEVSLRVAETLEALTLQRSLWRHIRLHRHTQTAEFGE